MSDEQTPEEASAPTTPGTSASAAAARRARRIGGRPAPSTGCRPETATTAAKPVTSAAPVSTKPVKLAKPDAKPSTTPEPDADDAADTSPRDESARPPAWLNWAPAGVLGAGALVMAVLLLVFSHGVWWGPDASKVPGGKSANVVREQVLAAAKTCVAATNTYKYTDLDTYETNALGCATGKFVGQLKSTIETLVKVNAPKLKSSQTALINRGGIEAVSSNGKQWTVLLYGQLTVVNTTDTKGRTDPFAAQVRMEKVKGEWLISGLSTVSTPLQ
jgi:hypothetical protein